MSSHPDESANRSVVRWTAHASLKCPVGSMAYHRRYGVVRVIDARGFDRTVEQVDLAVFHRSTASTRQARTTIVVDVRELQVC